MVQVVPFESPPSKTRGSTAEGPSHIRSAAEIPLEQNTNSGLTIAKQSQVVVHASKSITTTPPKLKNLERVLSSEGLVQKTDYRTLYLNDPIKNAHLRKCNNAVKTSKYTLWTLVPKNLFEQFRRLANIYFAIISILQVSTDLSPTNPYTSILTLGTMLVITLLKEAFEDWKRHRADKTVNRSSARVLQGSELGTCLWQDLKVGDTVFVENGEQLPADLLLLSTSEDQGMCYIETSNLDGETNLKIRQALEATASRSNPDSLSKLQGTLKYEQPNNRLYNFEGVISLQSGSEEPVDIKSVLLRGSMLRNTKWIYGLVIFTGKETKLIQNSRAAPSKRSNVEKTVNILIIIIFAVLLLMCTISTAAGSAWVNGNRSAWYLPFVQSQSAGTSAATWITFLILYNNVVPISLYVSMELVKVYQAQLIDNDLAMYHEESDTPALARTSNLNEDLGQIQYVFSDKTGTLTRNEMEFRKCSIGGTVYGLTGKDIPDDTSTDGSTEPRPRPRPGLRPTYLNDPKFQFEDARLMRHLVERHPNSANIDDFLRLLAVCHTVIPEKDRADPSKIRYEASSPDEGALVAAARNFGYAFATRTSRTVGIQVFGKEETYEVLNVNEFSSTRKRMSIICRTPQNKLLLFCKGADSVIFERLKAGESNEDLLAQLNDFATEGLRTLVLAKAELEPSQYASWSVKYREASTALSQRDEKLEAIAEEIEVNLTLMGATAIEDKLQEGVPDCIASMMAAGIKVWVLTGDKIETAINIGYSCHLLTAAMSLLIIQHDTREKLKDELTACLQELRKELEHSSDGPLRDRAIIIDGKPLRYIFEDKELQTAFLELSGHCAAVLACRVSPLQKAQVVRLVKRNVIPQPMTLAIGDGANDVSMIQEAHVGVGISGKEGMQAVRSADYAIGQFRFLKRLLLVHGRWDYQRISKVILYCFYKNIAMVLTLFYFGFFNGNSGTTLYESWLGALWNVGWTFFPIILLGVLDQDTSSNGCSEKEGYRQYQLGQQRTHFNAKKMAMWVTNAIWHSFIVFFLCYGLNGPDVLPNSGQVAGVWAFGTTLNFALVLTVNLKVSLETRYWTALNLTAVSGSLVFWILFVCAYSLMIGISWDYYSVAFYMFRAPIFWLTSLIVPVIALLPDFTTKFVSQNYSKIPQEPEKTVTAAHRGSISTRDPISDKLLSMKHFLGVGNQSMKIKKRPKAGGSPQAMTTGFAFNYPQWASDQEQITDVNTNTFTARPAKRGSQLQPTLI